MKGKFPHISFLEKVIDRKKCLNLFCIFSRCACLGCVCVCVWIIFFVYQTENILFSCMYFLLTKYILLLIW